MRSWPVIGSKRIFGVFKAQHLSITPAWKATSAPPNPLRPGNFEAGGKQGRKGWGKKKEKDGRRGQAKTLPRNKFLHFCLDYGLYTAYTTIFVLYDRGGSRILTTAERSCTSLLAWGLHIV